MPPGQFRSQPVERIPKPRIPGQIPQFVRVRIGVGKPPGSQHGADHVLRRPGKAERVELDIAIQEAADAVERLAAEGVEAAMNRHNTRGG